MESNAIQNDLNILQANSFTYSLQYQLVELITDAGRPIYIIKSSNDRARLCGIPRKVIEGFWIHNATYVLCSNTC